MASQSMKRLKRDAYTVALICPLEVEMSAARYMLDEKHASLPSERGDKNLYILGQLSGHNVAIASLPTGYQGKASAAIVASHMARTFPSIELRLLVGIGGGVPSKKVDIRLGDVAISIPSGTHGGVVQYDLGKQLLTGFQRKGCLFPPPTEWLAALAAMQSAHRTQPNRASEFISQMLEKFPPLVKYKRPPPHEDVLFHSDYNHDPDKSTCVDCDKDRVVNRHERETPDDLIVHYGLIASGDRVMKDATERDKISRGLGGAICFEMEASGLMNEFRCVVIRGISDYADSHKNDLWHPYAAAAAAALAKEVLSYIEPLPAKTMVETFYDVPRWRVDRFIGRTDLLKKIESAFFAHNNPSSRPPVLVLQGLGGQGKTQLALEFCRISKAAFRAIFWIDATSEGKVEENFQNIAAKLNESLKREFEDASSKIKFVLDRLENWDERWMLVFDNCDRSESYLKISQFIPQCGLGAILFTSRDKGANALGELIEVGPMTEDEGLELLLRDFKNEKKAQNNREEGLEIINRLGRLPLAIDQASAYIYFSGLPLSKFLAKFEEERKRILEYTREKLWRYESEQGKALNVYTTWEMSLGQIVTITNQQKDDIGHFLTLSAFLDRASIGEYLFDCYKTEGASSHEWIRIFNSRNNEDSSEDETVRTKPGRDSYYQDSEKDSVRNDKTWNSMEYFSLVRKLDELSLIQSSVYGPYGLHGEGVTFSLHPLIRDWLQLRRKKPEERVNYTREASQLLVTFLNSQHKLGTTAERNSELVAHMDACISNDGEFSKSRSTLDYENLAGPAATFAQFYQDQTWYHKSEDLFERILAAQRKHHGEEHPFTLTSMANLASTYLNQRRLAEAEKLFVKVIETRKRVLGQEHPDTLTSMGYLAETFRSQQRLQEAEKLFMQVMQMGEKVMGQENLKLLTCMIHLALTYFNQGKWEEAKKLEAQVVKIRTRVLGLEHPDTLTSMANLASTYKEQGQWREAKTLEMQITEIRERTQGQDHPDTLRSMANLASTYRSQGQQKKAEKLEMQVMEIGKRMLEQEHPSLTSMGNLAVVYTKQNQWKKAEELEKQVIRIKKKLLGQDHPETLSSMSYLAVIYGRQEKWKEAEKLEAKATETRKVLGLLEHHSALVNMEYLGLIYRKQEQWEKGEVLDMEVMEIRKRVLGQEHSDTLAHMHRLATTYGTQKQWKKAEELLAQVTETRQRVLGLEHPDTLTSMNSLGSIYWRQEQWKKAERLQMQVLEIRKNVLGQDHSDTLASMADLATTYGSQGRWKEGGELNIKVLETRKRLLGERHPETLISMDYQALASWHQGQWQKAQDLNMQLMKIRKEEMGEQHSSTLATMVKLASTHRMLEQWEDAEKLDMQVLEIRKRTLGLENSDTLSGMTRLAETYWNQRQPKKAEELLLQVMETKKRVVGLEDPGTLESMMNLALMFEQQGKLAEAEAMSKQALVGYKKALGPEHLSTLNAVRSLGFVYYQQGKLVEAEAIYEQARLGFEKAAGTEHLLTLNTVYNLGKLYNKQRRFTQAKDMYERARVGLVKVLGPKHPVTLEVVDNLGRLHRDQANMNAIIITSIIVAIVAILAGAFYLRAKK